VERADVGAGIEGPWPDDEQVEPSVAEAPLVGGTRAATAAWMADAGDMSCVRTRGTVVGGRRCGRVLHASIRGVLFLGEKGGWSGRLLPSLASWH